MYTSPFLKKSSAYQFTVKKGNFQLEKGSLYRHRTLLSKRFRKI